MVSMDAISARRDSLIRGGSREEVSLEEPIFGLNAHFTTEWRFVLLDGIERMVCRSLEDPETNLSIRHFAMVWSLSQDDDGLESVQPPPPGTLPPQSLPSDRPFPTSQAPQVKKNEPTLVLGERRLDSLRAEVKRRRRHVAMFKVGAILGWMLAGGAAVGAGVIAARSFSGGDTSSTERRAGAADAGISGVASAAPTETSSSQSSHSERVESVSQVAPPEPRPLASQPSPSEVAPRSSAPSPQSSAISLDDLPTEKKPVRKLRR